MQFTRYINHSCNPNLVTTQAYVKVRQVPIVG